MQYSAAMTKILVAGGGGFIGGHLVKQLIGEGNQVISVDQKPLSDWYQVHSSAENLVGDLQNLDVCLSVSKGVEQIYNLAADMGGMGFIELHKAECMLSVLINTHLLVAARKNEVQKFFFSSSACVYEQSKQSTSEISGLKEEDAYPAMPEDGYGWEKLFSERMCRHFHEDFGISTRIARYHNVYGPNGTYMGGREKAPAALARKVANAVITGNREIEVWGDGEQTRSFTYITDCIEGTRKLMDSDFLSPLNIGSSEMVSINGLINILEEIAGIKIERKYNLDAPQGVRGRNSDNTLVKEVLNWEPSIGLKEGMFQTYRWVYDQLRVC